MKKIDIFLVFLFFIIGIATRLPLVEKYQSHWDGPQYSIGVFAYNLSLQTPAPPGYPLYIAMGRVFYQFIHNPYFSILLVSVLFSGLGGVVIYITGKTLFNRSVGSIASLLYLSGPTFYYFGLTPYPYGLIPVTASVLALLVYLIMMKKKKRNIGILLGVFFAIAVGIRPQETPMFFPLYLLGLFYLPKKEKMLSVTGFVISILIWGIPFLSIVGGLQQYIRLLTQFLRMGAIAPISLVTSLTYASRMIKDFFLTFTISSVFIILYLLMYAKLPKNKKKITSILHNKYIQLFAFWMIPSVLVNFIIRSDHAGYQMTYLSASIFLIAYAIYYLFNRHRKMLLLVTVVLIVFNIFWFFKDRDPQNTKPYIPTSFHHSEMVKNDIRMPAIIAYISSHPSRSTLIISDPDLFREITYYANNYAIYSYEALATTTPGFKNTVFYNYELGYKSIQQQNDELILTPKEKTVILIPNNRPYTFKGIQVKKVTLAGNAIIYIFSVKKHVKYHVSQYSITKI